MTKTKDTIAKWVIVFTCLLWISVGSWGIYHCFQISNYGKATMGMNSSISALNSAREMNQILGLNVLQASMVFLACILASLFVLYSVATMKAFKEPATQTQTKTVHA